MMASTQGYLQSSILIFLFFVSFRFYCCIVKFLSTSFLFTHISYLIKNIHVYYYLFMVNLADRMILFGSLINFQHLMVPLYKVIKF